MNEAVRLMPTFLRNVLATVVGDHVSFDEMKNDSRCPAAHRSAVSLHRTEQKIQFLSQKVKGVISLFTVWPATLFFLIFGSAHHLRGQQIL